MLPSRVAARTARQTATRSARLAYRQPIRFLSFSSSKGASSGRSMLAGLAGGVGGAGVFYLLYSFTPAGRTASTINKAALVADKKYKEAAQTLQENTPDADQAVNSIKEFVYSYVEWIPGGRATVDSAFDDWELVRSKHKDEADKIFNDTVKKLQELAESGLSVETAVKVLVVIGELTKRVREMSGEALVDVIKNHPEIREKLGSGVDQLKRMGEEYGPDVKKQVDDTWAQIKDMVADGVEASKVNKARQLIDDKVQQIKKLRDETWDKAYEQAKPLLEKNRKVREMVEANANALKEGNAKELFDKVKSSVNSGNVEDLKKYVDNAVDHAKEQAKDQTKDKTSSGSGGSSLLGEADKYVQMIPQADEILPKLKQLSELAQNNKEEGERLLRETAEDLKKLLEEKSKKGQEILDKAKKESK